jgi:uncharacterized protein YlxW (UPF0749 family)
MKFASLTRDPVTSAIINNDEKEYREYQNKIDMINQIRELREEVNMLKDEVRALRETKEVSNV